MKFRVKVQNMAGQSWWEDYDKEIGDANTIRGHGQQPEFTGDIQAWGIAIVDWYNKDVPKDRKRRFLAAELIQENADGSTVTDRPSPPVASQRRGDRPKSRGREARTRRT
jgi:hypothetical protein